MSFFKPEDFNDMVTVRNAATIANRLLEERGVRGYAKKNKDGSWLYFDNESTPGVDTHTFLAIDIQPIKRDTAESLLRELIDKIEGSTIVEYRGSPVPNLAPLKEITDRARKILEGK